jgi:hypothetical protein
MTEFIMPLDITGEEKMIGGVFSLRQIAYLGAAFVLLFFFSSLSIPVTIKVVGDLLMMAVAAALAFLKIDRFPNTSTGISLDKYIMLWLRFRKLQKTYSLEEIYE